MRNKFVYPLLLVVIISILFVFLYNFKDDSTLKTQEKHLVEATFSSKEDIPSEITLENGSGKSFIVALSSIPDLQKYLDEETDIKTELERIQIEHLNWTITTADSIELVVADIPDATYESIEKWYKAATTPVKSVKITVE